MTARIACQVCGWFRDADLTKPCAHCERLRSGRVKKLHQKVRENGKARRETHD